MVIFAVFLATSAGLLVGALKSTGLNKSTAEAHQIAQADLEKLKGLLFQAASGATLLSSYYPNLTAAPGRGTTGYVAPASTRFTADGDPGSGAFYRTVVSTAPTAGRYTRYVTLQFIDTAVSPPAAVTPPATYSPNSLPLPTQTVRVGETVVWSSAGRRSYTVTSELTTGRASKVQSSAQASITAVRVTGITATGDKVSVSGPSVTADGALTDNAVAAVSARGAEATLSTGARALGATGVANAPADETAAATNAAPGALVSSGYTAGAFGPSTTSGLVAKASYATPLVSSSATPASATLSANGTGAALSMTNLDSVGNAPPKLQLASPVIASATVPCAGCTSFAARGWLATSDSSTTHSVNAAVDSNNGAALSLFPTTFAPNGVVLLTLNSSSLSCRAGGTYPTVSAPTATATYTATVQYWSAATNGYVTVALSPTSGGLTDSMLNTKVATFAGLDVLLRDYITSWNSASTSSLAAKVQTSADNRSIGANLDGFVNLTTAGVRTLDPATSGISVQLGVATCAGTDAR